MNCETCAHYRDVNTCTLYPSRKDQSPNTTVEYLWTPAQGRNNYCRELKHWEDRASFLIELFKNEPK